MVFENRIILEDWIDCMNFVRNFWEFFWSKKKEESKKKMHLLKCVLNKIFHFTVEQKRKKSG